MNITRFSSRRQRLDHAFLSKKPAGAKSYRRIAGYLRSSIFDINRTNRTNAGSDKTGPDKRIENSLFAQIDVWLPRYLEEDAEVNEGRRKR